MQGAETCRCCAGKYSNAVGASSCVVCPLNSNSPQSGSTSVTACTCNTGSTGPSGGPCWQCAAGKFKDAGGSDTCISCPVGKYGAAGAAAESECMACPAGKFGGREGSSTCADCAAGKVSAATACEDPLSVISAKDDDVVTGMAKDVLISIITSVILGVFAMIGAFFRNKISAFLCGQGDQNQQTNDTAEDHIVTSASPNMRL